MRAFRRFLYAVDVLKLSFLAIVFVPLYTYVFLDYDAVDFVSYIFTRPFDNYTIYFAYVLLTPLVVTSLVVWYGVRATKRIAFYKKIEEQLHQTPPKIFSLDFWGYSGYYKGKLVYYRRISYGRKLKGLGSEIIINFANTPDKIRLFQMVKPLYIYSARTRESIFLSEFLTSKLVHENALNLSIDDGLILKYYSFLMSILYSLTIFKTSIHLKLTKEILDIEEYKHILEQLLNFTEAINTSVLDIT